MIPGNLLLNIYGEDRVEQEKAVLKESAKKVGLTNVVEVYIIFRLSTLSFIRLHIGHSSSS